jgi:hypothetical protein
VWLATNLINMELRLKGCCAAQIVNVNESWCDGGELHKYVDYQSKFLDYPGLMAEPESGFCCGDPRLTCGVALAGAWRHGEYHWIER